MYKVVRKNKSYDKRKLVIYNDNDNKIVEVEPCNGWFCWSNRFAKTIKEYKEIQKLIDPLVKRFFEKYYEEWQHFSDWEFDDNGNIIINYAYFDYNDEWEFDSIDVSLDKIIEMI